MSNTEPTSDTDESPLNQPMKDSLPAQVMQSVPLLGVGRKRTTLDYVDTRRAFRNSYAVETSDGDAFIGAVKVSPASMGMKEDISMEVRQFASALTAGAEGEGMLVDVPRPVDTTNYQQAMWDVEESFAGDDATWSEQMRADLAEEEATAEYIYEQTTSERDHLIVLRVDKMDAARSMANNNNKLADLPIIGDRFAGDDLGELKSSDRLHRQMEKTLASRLERLSKKLSVIRGVNASPISSVRLSAILARYYRTDDPTENRDLSDYIRQSPIPGIMSSSTYTGRVASPTVSIGDDDPIDPVSVTDPKERARAYQAMLAPRADVSAESDGSFSIGDREVASIMVSGISGCPDDAFLESLYQYDNPNAEVSIATHFERISQSKAEREADTEKNSMRSMMGSVLEDILPEEHEVATEFADSVKRSDLGIFKIGTYVTVTAEATEDRNGNFVPAEDVLEEAVDDIIETEIKERCGLTATRLDDAHHLGWQTTAPAATNYLGTNTTVRADGLAKQFPYKYQNLDEPNGIRIGVHEYLQQSSHMQIYGPKRGNGHNIGVYGMIGSGKSTEVQDIILKSYLRHQHIEPNLKLVLATPLGDFKALSEALGGKRIVVGGGTGINPQSIRYVPPEKLRQENIEDQPWKDMVARCEAFLESYYDIENLSDWGDKKSVWIRAMKESQKQKAGIDPTDPTTYDKESATLSETISIIREMRDSPEDFYPEEDTDDDKTMDDVSEIARTIVSRDLEGFRDSGRFSHFLETSDVDLAEHDVLYLDFENYDGDDRMGGLEMQMRLSDIYEQMKAFDGRGLMAIDEFATMLENPQSAQFFKQTHRRSRHWNLSVLEATQQVGDVFAETDDGSLSDTAEVIKDNQAMQFYYYAQEMDSELASRLDLSEQGESYVSDAQTGDPDLGFAQCLAVVDGDEYPLRVEMTDDINPRAFALYRHEPTEDPPVKEFLRNYGDESDTCDWRWD